MVSSFSKKKIFTTFIKISFYTSVIFYLLACLTPYISPKYFYPLTFLAIGFPLLLIVMLVWLIFFGFYKKKFTLIVFVIILFGFKNIISVFSFHLPQQKLEQKSTTAIRVLSWNVMNFVMHEVKNDTIGNPYKKMMNFLKSTNADIICIQDFEQLDSSIFLHPISYIKDSLFYPYVYLSPDIDTTTFWGHSYYGTCIFSKFPIVNSSRVQYNGKHFTESLAIADISYNNKIFRVFNTHLRSMYTSMDTTLPREDFKYVIDDTNLVFHSSKLFKIKHFDTSHINQIEIIKKVFDTTKTPFVFCADLNSVPSSFVYHKLSENLIDAFTEKGLGWKGTYASSIPFLRIDVVLMSKQFKTLQYFSPTLNLSNHYPVIADISLN